MSRAERIERDLRVALQPEVVEVLNESGMHAVPKGSETHFKVVIVAPAFDGLSRVERHQLVYRALSGELASGLHALSIVSKTPAEWARDSAIPASPKCEGGSKADSKR